MKGFHFSGNSKFETLELQIHDAGSIELVFIVRLSALLVLITTISLTINFLRKSFFKN